MQTFPRRRVLLALIVSTTFTFAIQAQAPPPSFEVASIRMESAHSAEQLMNGTGVFSMSAFPTARFFVHFTSLDFLIAEAYGIDQQYIQNDADWMDSQLYSVDATVEGGRPLTEEQIKPLLLNLLEQRFHLKAHRTTKLVSGFELVIAKDGQKLQSAKDSAGPTRAQIMSNRFDAWNAAPGLLAGILLHVVNEPVVDKTGLTGSYDIHLTYAPLNSPNADSALPDIFTAIQDQLGLKLVPAKVPVDYLVIDHADRIPTEN